MSKVSVYSRAHRALRTTLRFHFLRDQPQLLDPYLTSIREAGDVGEVVGVYDNPDNIQPEVIVVTERGLLIVNARVPELIEFAQIAAIGGPADKRDDSTILLTLRSGRTLKLPVAGRDERFADVFAFVRFLDRVLEDLS